MKENNIETLRSPIPKSAKYMYFGGEKWRLQKCIMQFVVQTWYAFC